MALRSSGASVRVVAPAKAFEKGSRKRRCARRLSNHPGMNTQASIAAKNIKMVLMLSPSHLFQV
jgi:hypothetical protein